MVVRRVRKKMVMQKGRILMKMMGSLSLMATSPMTREIAVTRENSFLMKAKV